MTIETRTRYAARVVGLALAALLASETSSAQGPPWAYAEYEEVWARVQSDEDGTGAHARLSVPLGQYLYATAEGSTLDAQFDHPSIQVTDEFEEAGGGLGLHSTYGKAHAFGLLRYASRTKRSYYSDGTRLEDERDGGSLTLGARILVRPWLTLEPEGGVGYSILGGFARMKIGVRLVPHLWLVGGYSAGAVVDSDAWTAGLRLTWKDSTPVPRKPRGARIVAPAGEPKPAALAPGITVVALRALRLQARPLFGAPEIAVVPAGATLALQKSTHNDFGDWWYVSADGQEGWIRETELK